MRTARHGRAGGRQRASVPASSVGVPAHAAPQIEPLTDDYLASAWLTTGRTSGVLPHGNEAPAMFRRAGLYYALVSDSCCFCGQGGNVRAFMASSPLGPYTYTGAIAAGPNPFNNGGVSTSSQQTNVFVTRGGQFVWQGDRWQSAPVPARFKGQGEEEEGAFQDSEGCSTQLNLRPQTSRPCSRSASAPTEPSRPSCGQTM